MRALAALFLALAAGAALGGEVYSWRDANGKVHYSDAPPPGVDARKVRSGVPAPAAAADNGAQRSLAEQELDFRKRRAESEKAREKAEKEQAESGERRQNCDKAKGQLQALETGQRLVRFGADGDRVVLDDEARARETAAARKAVQDWCK